MAIYLINLFSLLLWQAIYQKMPKTQKSKLIIMTLIFVQFVLIQGLRDYSVGIDTANYVKYYNAFSHKDFFHMLAHPQYVFEVGYMILMYVCKNLGVPTRMFIIIVAIIINFLYFRFIYKESNDFVLSLWLFICMEYFTLSFTTYRQIIAMGFIVNSFIYLKDDKYLKFSIFVLLAASFHKSALIFVIVPIIKFIYRLIDERSKIGKFLVLNRFALASLAIVILIFIKPLIIDVVTKLYPNYSAGGELGMLFFEILVVLFATLMCEHLTEEKTKLRFYQLFILLSTCVQYCTTIFFMINRVTLYFYVFSIVGIPYCLYLVKDMRTRRIFLMAILLLSFIEYYYVTMDMYNVVPYVLGDFTIH